MWDDTEHPVLGTRITTFLPNKFILGISTVKTSTGLESPFRRCLPSLPNCWELYFSVPIAVPFKLSNKMCTKHLSTKQSCDFQSSLEETTESLTCALHHFRLTSFLHTPALRSMHSHAATVWQTYLLPMSSGDSDLVTPRELGPTVLMSGNISSDSALLIKASVRGTPRTVSQVIPF